MIRIILESEAPKSKPSSGNMFTDIATYSSIKINFMKLNSVIIKHKKHSLTQSYNILRDLLLYQLFDKSEVKLVLQKSSLKGAVFFDLRWHILKLRLQWRFEIWWFKIFYQKIEVFWTKIVDFRSILLQKKCIWYFHMGYISAKGGLWRNK